MEKKLKNASIHKLNNHDDFPEKRKSRTQKPPINIVSKPLYLLAFVKN